MKNFRSYRSLAAFSLLFLGASVNLKAGEVSTERTTERSIINLKETAKGFTAVAKKVTPAVVSIEIRAESVRPGSSRRGPRQGEDPFNFFQDEFFRQFFGGGAPQAGPQGNNHQEQNPVIGRSSGFIVSSDGYILTNNHVVKDADKIVVALQDGRELDAEVIGADPGTDIAVIKVDAEGLPYARFGDSDALEVGEWVIAIGNPLGLQASVTVGVVSAKGRNNLEITDFDDFIQTDAAINPGNSGGPLLDLDGNVIGMNTAIVTKSGGYMGIGFAIPINMTQHIMQQIIDTGSVSRGFLGIAPQDLDFELAESFGLDNTEGVLVAQVVEESPAAVAGVKQGDIILEINGVQMENVATLRKTVALMNPGAQIHLYVSREGREIELDVDLGTHPQSPSKHMNTLYQKLGLEVEEITPELREEFSYRSEDTGLVVKNIAPRSPAAMAGMRRGDLLLAVDRKEVKNLAEFSAAMKEAMQDNRVLLLVKQGYVMRFISLRTD